MSPRRRLVALAVGVLVAGSALVYATVLRRSAARILAPPPKIGPDLIPPERDATSSLDFPVEVRIEALLAQVETHVPVEWGTLDDPIELPDRGRTHASVALQRSPFQASLDGNDVTLSATVFYALKASYALPLLPDVGMSCATGEGDVRPRLAVTLVAPLELTEDWSLRSRTVVGEVRAFSDEDRDRCEVTLAGIDVTGSVVDATRGFLETRRAAIDSIVADADVRSSFQRWWEVLREPIELGSGVWLALRPRAIRRGLVDGRGDVVAIRAQLEAEPQVVFGRRPVSGGNDLPPLRVGVTEGGLRVLVEGVAEYPEISRELTRVGRGRSFAVGRRRLVVDSMGLSGIGEGRIAMEVTVEGDVRGTLFMVGTPVYDAARGFVYIPDLSLTVSTSNLLFAGATWVLDAGLEAVLRETVRWPVDGMVAWARDALAAGLNATLSDGVRLRGSVDRVAVTDVLASTEHLLVRGVASGHAELLVEGGG